MYQMELEKNLLTNFEPSELAIPQLERNENYDLEGPADVLPVRKTCQVKSLPIYKGFSAPAEKVSNGKRWRQQKSKFTGKYFKLLCTENCKLMIMFCINEIAVPLKT